jgi:asparagine synthase (glutamine-hydrolysing)
MRRLSIIDVAGGRQPIANEDGSVRVIFNGELYNHHRLRERLKHDGHQFRTSSDTETLVHLYEEHGDRLVEYLRGMFAFAIWDVRRDRILLARDRLGIKPLYYRELPDGLVFASELGAILAFDGASLPIDQEAIGAYLALGYVPDPKCVYRGVRKLPPGHTLSWTREAGSRVAEYWTPMRPEVAAIDEAEAIEEVRRLLIDAVEARLESEVPLGAFLSGGVDSSTVVALMARAVDRKVQTFSIGFDDPEYNEAPHAAAVARALGTDHTELIVHPDADELIEQVVSSFDEPFADSSALPTYLVAQLARQQVTVALSGDGGDELFGGYTRYQGLLRSHEVPATLRPILRKFALRLPQGALGRNRLLDLSRSRRGRYVTTVAASLRPIEGGVARPGIADLVGTGEQLLNTEFERAMTRDFGTQMTLVDMMTYLPGDILTKVDRATMSVSLEARVPVLDHPLVEFAVGLPSRLKFRNGDGKWILREAVRDLVPKGVLTKPKQGFAVPLDRWFRRDLRHRVDGLLATDSPLYEYVEPAPTRRLASEHLTGRRNHAGRLWRLLVLQLWLTRQSLLAEAPSRADQLLTPLK